jgi:hypothetical protein
MQFGGIMSSFNVFTENPLQAKIVFDPDNYSFDSVSEEIKNLKHIEFDFSKVDKNSLYSFALSFLGWVQKCPIPFAISELSTDKKEELKSIGFFDMVEVIQLMKAPHKTNATMIGKEHKKINMFIKHMSIV